MCSTTYLFEKFLNSPKIWNILYLNQSNEEANITKRYTVFLIFKSVFRENAPCNKKNSGLILTHVFIDKNKHNVHQLARDLTAVNVLQSRMNNSSGKKELREMKKYHITSLIQKLVSH